MKNSRALLLIDLQNDFCTGGALAVPGADEVIAVANHLAADFRQQGEWVIASQDWHPPCHGSFASVSGKQPYTQGELNGIPQIWWPDHCIQQQSGAAFHPQLEINLINKIFPKGEHADTDSYSAFFDNGHRHQTGLDAWLRAHNINHLTIMGLATDYCVKFSVLDALTLGYRTEVIQAGCRGVDIIPGDSQRALAEMQRKGAKMSSL
ncbi:bifunctional nicotinamidase/pyrazinamidase [Enterobacteriaceae bacterium LUAb1]